VDNRVGVICPDHDGVMWFGTFWGISRYDGREFVNLTLKDGLVGRWVRAIYRDPDGAIWFGTNWGGVSRYDGEAFVNFTIFGNSRTFDSCGAGRQN
jgi:ligand-binding sensor domain-containing protein